MKSGADVEIVDRPDGTHFRSCARICARRMLRVFWLEFEVEKKNGKVVRRRFRLHPRTAARLAEVLSKPLGQ